MKVLTAEEGKALAFIEGGSRRTRSACANEMYKLIETLDPGQMVLINAEDWTNKTYPYIDKKYTGGKVFTTRTLQGRTGWAIIRGS